MIKKGIIYFIGVLTGIMILLFVSRTSIDEDESLKGNKYRYMILHTDYTIEDIGTIKKGAKLRIDREMEEGFTRCILYLNHKQGKTEFFTPEKPNMIIPYWLQPVESLKANE